jgi:hypothetical protein
MTIELRFLVASVILGLVQLIALLTLSVFNTGTAGRQAIENRLCRRCSKLCTRRTAMILLAHAS